MVVYAYLPIGEHLEKRILKVRNPENRKEKYEVEYLKKKSFNEFRKKKEDTGKHVYVAGSTKFKPFDENDKGNQQLFLKGSRFHIENEKSIFRHTKGYVKVKPLYEKGELQEAVENDNTTHFIAVTRLTLFPLLLFLLPFLLCLLSHCPKAPAAPLPEPTTADTITQIVEQTTMPTDSDIVPWNGELPTSPSSETDQEEIELIGYDKLTVSENSRFVDLINPKGNTVYFRYSVKANGVEVYNTELIPPNMYIPWNAYSTLTQMGLSGEVNIEFNITTIDINSYAPCNPATIKTTITIN